MRLGHERREEVLTVPEGEYKRQFVIDPIIEIGRFDGNALRLPDEFQIGRYRAAEYAPEGFRCPDFTPHDCAATRRLRRALVGFRVEQPVQMHNEVAHECIIDSLLRFRLPRLMRARIVRIDSNNVQTREVAEFGTVEPGQFTAENEIKKLLLRSHRSEHVPTLL